MGVARSTVCRRLFATGSRRGAYDPYRTTQHDSTRLNGRERDAHDVAACIHRVGSASVIPVKPGKTTRSPHGPTVIATLRGRDTAMHLPTIRPGSLIPAAAPGDHPTAVARIALASQRLSASARCGSCTPPSPAVLIPQSWRSCTACTPSGTSREDRYGIRRQEPTATPEALIARAANQRLPRSCGRRVATWPRCRWRRPPARATDFQRPWAPWSSRRTR